jgi:hypothetical protein
MARKISGGLVGSSTLVGSIQISPDAELATAVDQNITLSPGGDGQVISTANIQLDAQTDLRFGDADSSNWVAFQAPATVSSNVTWTLPAADGSSNQVLTTNASGVLSWSSKDVAISDQTASATTHYVTITTSSTGVVTTLNVSTTKLTYQPSTGTLSSTLLRATGNTASNSTSTGALVVSGGVGVAGAIYAGSDVVAHASSDIRLKEDISQIDNSLEKLSKISGYEYFWNKTAQEMFPERTMRDVGVIAQEVREVLPSAVVERADGYLAVNYDKIIPLLIESIKTLKEELDMIKREK